MITYMGNRLAFAFDRECKVSTLEKYALWERQHLLRSKQLAARRVDSVAKLRDGQEHCRMRGEVLLFDSKLSAALGMTMDP